MGRGMGDVEEPDAPAVVPAVRSVTPLSGCDAAFLTRHARRILPYASRTPHSLRDTHAAFLTRHARRIPYASHAAFLTRHTHAAFLTRHTHAAFLTRHTPHPLRETRHR